MAATIPASKMPGEKRRAQMPDPRLKRLSEFRRLKVSGIDSVVKKRRGRKNGGDSKCRGQQRAQDRVETPGVDVARLHALINDSALLKEKHPWCHRSADIGKNQQQNLAAIPGGQRRPRQHRVADGEPVRPRENRRGNKEAIEDGEAQRDAFPSPVAARGDCADDDRERSSNRNRGANAEKSPALRARR